MSIWEILLVGLGLSMDAVAVTLSNALVCGDHKNRWLMPVFFGAFQGIMPIIGYFAGSLFAEVIAKYSGYVVFAILAFIGGKMLWEGLHHKEEEAPPALSIQLLLVQAVATSIDALAVGVGFSVSGTGVWVPAGIIALTTAACSLAALLLGRKVGKHLGCKAEVLGGVILILIGVKALVSCFI
ncbi:MAG: manganese efflux pump MntP family protein [Eubacteriales bacterium]|nr:manganese efflux pump MntP family protein [Eubacteriales bacterium]